MTLQYRLADLPPEVQEQLRAQVAQSQRIRESCREWAVALGYRPATHHELILDRLQQVAEGRVRKLMIFMPPGSAKALALDTPIPTPTGWSTIGELQVGDEVIDEVGRPTRVIRKSPVFHDRPLYRVRTDCGDEIVADDDHQWLVRLCGKRPVEHLKTSRQLARRRAKRPMITRARALDLPKTDLPIDPYLLGLWLGDGETAGMRITAGVEDQVWQRQELAHLGIETSTSTDGRSYGVLGQRARFAALGLLGNKHIPPAYLRAAREDRLSLLQGLIDSDGTVCRERGCTTFCSTNGALAAQVRELVRTLGVKAGWSEGRAVLNGKDCGPSFKVSFYLAGSARLPRKANLTRDQYRTPNTYIDVEPAGYGDTQCIEVDSASHLFLAGLSMTPTHNSTYASIVFASWAMQFGYPLLAASHTDKLARRWGRRVRNTLVEHGHLLGVMVDPSNSAADQWSLTNGTEYKAAGLNVGISGFRAGGGLIDDPLRNRADADSETIREAQWEWYMSDFARRLTPNAWQIVIQTRWHEDDLSGRLIDVEGTVDEGGQWTILSLPAEAEANDPLGRQVGQMLWDDDPSYPYGEQLRRDKRTMPARVWSALFQQRPAPEEGDYFQRAWFHETNARPDLKEMEVYGGSDYAVTADGGDFTVHLVVGIDPEDRLWILDVWRKQTATDEWVQAFIGLIRRYEPLGWGVEAGQILSAMGPVLRDQMRKAQAFVALERFATKGDKAVRAQSIRGRAAIDGIYIPANSPWWPDLRSELLTFPAGKHDDQVDALGLVGQLLDKMITGTAERRKVEHRPMGGIETITLDQLWSDREKSRVRW